MAKGKRIEIKAGVTGAIIAAGIMLIMGILGNIGLYAGAVTMMQQWHMFFNLSITGIILGMIEAAIITFVIVYVSIWTFNKIK